MKKKAKWLLSLFSLFLLVGACDMSYIKKESRSADSVSAIEAEGAYLKIKSLPRNLQTHNISQDLSKMR